jgi:RNA polymerase sigma factor (sigma-70 family)
MGWQARLSTPKSADPTRPLQGIAASACDAESLEATGGGRSRLQTPGEPRALHPSRAARRLRALYVTLRPEVARIAGALIGERPPSDLVHDICVEVTLSKARFRRDCAFSTWMYSILGHHVHNWIRSERNRRRLILAAEQASSRNRVLRPDEALDTFVVVDQLRRGFATLTERQRACLLLVRWECLSPREVATRLNTTPAAVRMNVHRARAHLRKWLEDGQ